jgi:nitroreductase
VFVAVQDRERLERLSGAVFEPGNVRGAGLAVAIVLTNENASFDAGRAAQSMLLAAWNDGVSSCPNGIADETAARDALELGEGETPRMVLSFGRPQKQRRPDELPAAVWSARANRKPSSEVVRHI